MLNAKAQTDTIITTNNDTILCEILDNIDGHIVYRKEGKLTGDAISPDSIKYMSKIIVDVHSEQKKYRKKIFPFINVSIGYGANFGIIGAKTVLGFKNSGLLIGIGYGGIGGYQIGAQISNESFFANIGYGSVGWYQARKSKITINGTTVIMGGMTKVGKRENIFIDLGIGYMFGDELNYGNSFINVEGLTIGMGMGFRFNLNKKKFEDING